MQFSALQFACSQSLIYERAQRGPRNVIADPGLLLPAQQSFVCITLCARLYAYNLDAGTKTVVTQDNVPAMSRSTLLLNVAMSRHYCEARRWKKATNYTTSQVTQLPLVDIIQMHFMIQLQQIVCF